MARRTELSSKDKNTGKGMSTIQIVLLDNSKTSLQVSCGSSMDHLW